MGDFVNCGPFVDKIVEGIDNNQSLEETLEDAEVLLQSNFKTDTCSEAINMFYLLMATDPKKAFRFSTPNVGGHFKIRHVNKHLEALIPGFVPTSASYEEFQTMMGLDEEMFLVVAMQLYINVLYKLLLRQQPDENRGVMVHDEATIWKHKCQAAEKSHSDLQKQMDALQAQVARLLAEKKPGVEAPNKKGPKKQFGISEAAVAGVLAGGDKNRATAPSGTSKHEVPNLDSEDDHFSTSNASDIPTDEDEVDILSNMKSIFKGDNGPIQGAAKPENTLSTFGRLLSQKQQLQQYEKTELMSAERSNYAMDGRPMTMRAIVLAIQSDEGFVLHSIDKGTHTFRQMNATKAKGEKMNRFAILFPPHGVSSKAACSSRNRVQYMFPRSRQQGEDFFNEQQDLLNDQSERASTDIEALREMNNKSSQLAIFRRKFARMVEVVMDPYPKQHVTLWAVLAHFLLITWNTAMVFDDISLLNRRFQERWEANFADKSRMINGVSVQQIQESMIFLQYYCPNPGCFSTGMDGSHCFHCGTGSCCDSAVTTNKAGSQEAFRKWKAAQLKAGVKAPITYASFKASAASTATTPSPAVRATTRTIVSTYEALARDQSEIVAPASSYFGTA
jgi:hypothetical protein